MDLAHPLGVAPGEVVVDRDDVDALAGERVEITGQGRDERLTFTRSHLGDSPRVQHHAADQLDVVVTHLERPHRGFAHRRKRIAEDVVERRAVVELLLELARDRAELGVALRFHRVAQLIDPVDVGLEFLQLALVLAAEDFLNQSHR